MCTQFYSSNVVQNFDISKYLIRIEEIKPDTMKKGSYLLIGEYSPGFYVHHLYESLEEAEIQYNKINDDGGCAYCIINTNGMLNAKRNSNSPTYAITVINEIIKKYR